MKDHDLQRRRFVRDSGLLIGAAASGLLTRSLAVAAPSDISSAPLQRIAFGSCAHQDKDQPIWEAVLATNPDLFIFLGDNIYGDTRDMAMLRAKYAQLAAKPGFQRLRATTPILAIWDDHDYGENDAGSEYPQKEESRRIFLEFWNEPGDSLRWSRDGIYTSHLFGSGEQAVQIILPDLRFNRTPISKIELDDSQYKAWAQQRQARGDAVPGPYSRTPDPAATMLGERQWKWLEEQFDVPASVRIFASSLQVLADFPGWEAWINYAQDHQRLIDLIRRKRVTGLVFISGDTHYAELSRLDVNVPYPLWDLTSSGLTEVWPVEVPNARRVGSLLREPYVGLIEINWEAQRVTLQALDASGRVRIAQSLSLAELSPDHSGERR
jgi:alkaline phosphatase D